MGIFENEEFIGKLKGLKGEVLELCGKFSVYKK
jgi:hypothetical protein